MCVIQMDANQSDVTIDVVVNGAINWIDFLHSQDPNQYCERYRTYNEILDGLMEAYIQSKEEVGYSFIELFNGEANRDYFNTLYELQEQARDITRRNYRI